MQREQLLKMQLSEVNKKIDTIEEKYFITGEMKADSYEKFSVRFQEEKKQMVTELENCSGTISNLQECLQHAVTISQDLNEMWASGDIRMKERLLKISVSRRIVL